MPIKTEQRNRLTCRLISTQREVYFNGYDTGMGTDDRGQIWSEWGTTTRRSWQRTPNYVALKKAGTLPDNSLNYERTEHNNSEFVMVRSGTNATGGGWDVKSYYYENRQTYTPLMTIDEVPQADVDTLVAQASLKAITGMKSNQFNTPVFMAEAHKTVQMVTNRATQLAHIAMSLRRGNLVRAFKLLHPDYDLSESKRRRISRRYNQTFGLDASKAASNAWLELQYGWTPFMLETRSAVNTLMDVVEDPRNRVIRVTGSARRDSSSTRDGIVMVSPRINGVITTEHKTSARVVWKAVPSSADLPGRFGLTNPLEVAWELVPLSFVADWFVPIGDYLSALDAPMRFQHKGGVIGVRRESKGSVSYDSSPEMTFVSGKASITRIKVSVNPLTGTPIPSFPSLFVKPGMLSIPRMASAIALLRQFLIVAPNRSH